MIELHTWTTPNGHKVAIFLEEVGAEYEVRPVNISKGEQFGERFLAIAPNNRIPAIVDHDPPGGGAPVALFESGAILIYLAEKHSRFLPTEARERAEVLQWLMWQMSGVGPMLGQDYHFRNYAPEKIGYAIDRYARERDRLLGVLDGALAGQDHMAGSGYSIADMATYPFIRVYRDEEQGVDWADHPNIVRWLERMSERPAVARAYDLSRSINTDKIVTDASRRFLFGGERQ